jgi:hypothetical protein
MNIGKQSCKGKEENRLESHDQVCPYGLNTPRTKHQKKHPRNECGGLKHKTPISTSPDDIFHVPVSVVIKGGAKHGPFIDYYEIE